jgi:outer membrane protein assembly factor BamB
MNRKAIDRRLAAILVVFFSISAPAFLLAQNRVSERDNFHNTAYIKADDDVVKAELFRFGEALGEGNHSSAVAYLMRVLKSESDAMVPFGERTFLSVRETGLRHLVRLPEPALALYMERASGEAMRELSLQSVPGGEAALEGVVDDYPLTRPAFEAIHGLGTIAFERGEYLKAARRFRQGLREASLIEKEAYRPGPDFIAQMNLSLYIALRMAGRPDEARAHRPEGPIVLGGEQRSPEELEAMLASLKPASASRGGWPLRGGHRSRVKRPSFPHTRLAPQWDFPLRKRSDEPAAGPWDPMVRKHLEAKRIRATVYPIMDDGALYLFDERAFHPLDLETGEHLFGPLLWDWSLLFGGKPVDLESVTFSGAKKDRYFYAVLNQRVEALGEASRHQGAIIAMDLEREGYVLWKRGGVEEADAALRNTAFTGAPAVVGDRVFILGTRYASPGEARAQAVLYAFQGRSGALLFERFLCSGAEVSRFELRFSSESRKMRDRVELGSPVAEYGGVLYCLTNLGVVAAVDAYSGEVRWLFKYNRIVSQDPSRYERDYFLDTGGWRDSLPMVKGGRLYTAPEDSRFLYQLDLNPDPEGFIILEDPIEKGRYIALVGLAEDRFYFSARESARNKIVCTERHGAVIWETPSFEKQDRISGAPLLVQEAVLVPTERYIYRIDLRMKGLITHSFPLPEGISGRRGRPVRFGNIIVVDDYLVSVSNEDVIVFKGVSEPR